MERTYCVYKHTNRTNGKVYIGITHDPNKRWRGSGCAYKSNTYFWQAIQKYGWEGFDHEVLYEGLTKERACDMEVELISSHRSTEREFGYNHSPGGDSPLVIMSGELHPMFGKHHSPEVRAKMAASHKGELHNWYGKHLSEETKRKIGDANRGRKLPEWQIEHLRQINTGRKDSVEARKKKSDAQRGHPVSEETRQKIRETKESKPVVQMLSTGEVVCVWPSVVDAARGSGLDRSQIRKCCNGVLKTSGGFCWKFK